MEAGTITLVWNFAFSAFYWWYQQAYRWVCVQTTINHLRQTLVFMWSSALRENFSFCFSGEFYKCWQSFHFGDGGDWALGNNYVRFWDCPGIFQFPKIPSLITRSYTSFHLWWNENLLNHPKVSEYYEHNCSLVKKSKQKHIKTRCDILSKKTNICIYIWWSHSKPGWGNDMNCGSSKIIFLFIEVD